MKANYSYLSDGTKASVLNASGTGYDYNGFFTYSHASGGTRTLESVAFGIALDDFGARRYDRTAWTSIDPLAEKYYSISPYAYCAGNPVKFVDVKGDSLAVLNLSTSIIGHSALLIKNGDNKWAYYSYNGDWIFSETKKIGGKAYHDIGEKTFDSPQDFLDSTCNREGSFEEANTDSINNYDFPELYVLPTTPSQDCIVRQNFMKETQIRYNLLSHQCANVVENSLEAAGIKVNGHSSYFPNRLYEKIKKANPNGQTVIRKR